MFGSLQEKDRGYQVFPASGPLHDALNLSGRDLIQRLGEIEGSVYCYIVTSVNDRGGLFVQTGSAPNFQGGLITLCTCKWRMRTGRDLDAWPGRWIAGVTGAEAGPQGRGHLLYLMCVERAFESHRDLWLWLTEHAPEAAEARAADRHRVGDVYRPRASAGSPFDPDAYIPPHPHHVHSGEKWRKDINYIGHSRRRPALLVGDPHNSFLWSEPRVRVPFHVGRGHRIVSLRELLAPREGATGEGIAL